MNIKEIKVNRFDGGKAYDKRLAGANEFGASINFDIHSYPSLLTPVRDYEDEETYNGVSEGIKASDIACFGQVGNSTVYGIGRKNDGTGRKIYNKTITASTWLETNASSGAVAESSTGCALPGFFIEQRNSSNSSLYWFVTGNDVPSSSFWQIGLLDYTQSAGPNFAKKTLAFNPTFKPQAIVGIDGVVYVSDNNKIHGCNSDTTIDDSVFTVSPLYNITSMCLYGTYLAIAIYGIGRSKVLLWDYNNAQATEMIDWGEGALMVLENLDGVLVGVTDKYINSSLFSEARGTGSMEIKTWSGGLSTLTEVRAKGVVANAVEQYKFVKNGAVYWYAKIPLDSTGTSYEEGIWAFGRKTSNQPYSLYLHRETAGTSFEGFWGIGDYFYLPHSGDGSISKSSSTATFTLTSSYETPLINGGDSSIEKNAMGFSLGFDAFPSGATLALKYRRDGDSNWITVDPIISISTGDLSALYTLDFNFRDIEFRLESTGGAIPTSYKFRYEELSDINHG